MPSFAAYLSVHQFEGQVMFDFYRAWFFKRFYLFIFRERGREGEREGENHQCVVASHVPPTRDPGMGPDGESNQ